MSKILGVLIRKVNINERGIKTMVTRNDYRKQLITLLKKLKKNDPGIYFQYSIERDGKSRFHTHLIIHYNHSENLHKGLLKFIGGNGQFVEKDGTEGLKTIQGRFGEIDIHNIWDERGFSQYINKYQPSEILI